MKKKALVLAICMACAAPAVSLAKAAPNSLNGLNLGELQSSSYLGEPFRATIPILFTSSKQAKQLKISLAPSSIYRKLGAEKSHELNKLQFKVSNKTKKPSIVISSKGAINLPLLNLILEIESAQGSIYQDFTIMLDPKGYNNSNNVAIKTAQKNNSTSVSTATNKYKVKRGDSLSKISQKFKSNRVSLNRMMEAIHRKNPKAFIDDDINRIKSDIVLNIPSSNEVKNFDLIIQKPVITSEKSKTPKTKEIEQTTQATQTDTASSTSNKYQVQKGDTLSGITRKLGQKGVSFTKMMKAIHSSNPHAFSKNRINLLKAGAVLTIPTFNNDTSNANIATQNLKDTDTNSILEFNETKTKTKIETQPTQTRVVVVVATQDTVTAVDSDPTKELESANTEIIKKLEKRVRELRGELSSATTDYSVLKAELAAKDDLIYAQEKEVVQLQDTINDLDESQENTSTTQKDSLNIATNEQTETFQNDDLKIQSKEPTSNESDNNNLERDTISPTSIEQVVGGFLNKKLADNSDLLSVKNLSYASLALILGFLIIRRRRELNSYTPILKDNPLVNSSKDIIPSNIFEESLVFDEPNLTKTTEPQKDKQEFSKEKIQECELLVDELIEDLENHEPSTDKTVILESVCDHEVDSLLEGNHEIDYDNFIQEDIIDTMIMNKPNHLRGSKDALNRIMDSEPSTRKNQISGNSASSTTKLFEKKMDKLVDLVSENEQTQEKEIANDSHRNTVVLS